MAASTSSVLPELPIMRTREAGEQRATFFELFFDLVYVFAVTQLSHHLLAHLSWSGAAQTAFMLVALYWAWNYTTWMTNWFDPDTVPVRLVLVFVMLASLLMAVAIPEGFSEHALLFACAYSGLQIGRNAFVVAVTPRGRFNQNFRQILAWSVLSAPLWVAGGVVDADGLRWALWLGALGLDLAGPLAAYWLPRFGQTPMSQWQIEGAHFGERFQLFVIIALGESIVLAGATASDTGLSIEVVAALLFAFLSSTALWWLYFGQVARTVLERIRMATIEERGQIGRDIYTYLHLPIVAGIVLVAVADELVIAHPTDDLHDAGALVALGGPAVFLAGLMAAAARIGHAQSRPRALAAVALLAAVPLAAGASGLLVSALLTALLGLLVVAEQLRDDDALSGRSLQPAEPD
ncbi:MAG TPA: low temperature requirement protein A [Thermoleophilaceae bacterium]|nr:low temperature requirement protein A [Thermoleophilaceae bacterium]